MSTNTAAAYGMYPRNIDLPAVVCALNRAGFGNRKICMVLSPAHPDADPVRDARFLEETPESSVASEQLIEWFSGLGAVVIPTVGFFIRSQEFLPAVFTEHNFPSMSRGSRILIGLGFAEEEARRLGYLLSDVCALVYVSCEEPSKAVSVIQLLRETGAREASSIGLEKVQAAAA